MILFWLGMAVAGLFAVGMDPYSCGLPLLLLACAIMLASWKRSPHAAQVGPTVWWILLTVGYFAWRMSQSPIADFGRSDGLLLAGAVLGFWWAAFCGNATSFPRWIAALWLLFLANIGVAVWQEYGGPDVYALLGERVTDSFPSGLYLHYNHFSNFMLGVGLLSLGYGLAGRMNPWWRWGGILVYGLAVYGIYLSHSRGAWVGLGFGTALVLVGWLIHLHTSKARWAGAVIVITVSFTPLLVMGALNMGLRAVSNRPSHDPARLEYASIAMDLIQEKPVWGGGSRSYFYNSVKKVNPQELWMTNDIEYVHNEYLQTAVDYGLVGALLLLGVMILVFFRGIVFLLMGDAKSAGDRGIALGCMGALAGMGVQAFFSFVYHVLPDVILLGACMGWLVRQPWVMSEPKWRDLTKPDRMHFDGIFGVIGCGIGLSILLFAARDAAAWMVMNPRLDFAQDDRTIQAERLQRALEIRPDFRYYGQAARLWSRVRTDDETPNEKRLILARQSVDLLLSAVERAPDSHIDWVHLAMLYDVLGEYEKAEPIYQRWMPILRVVEINYGVHYLYARHLSLRAQAMWRQRKPSEALSLFLQAREKLLAVPAVYRYGDPSLRQLIEKSIRFLEGAGIRKGREE